ncbi:hypothetical protein Noc_1360 [Nitrosococcus oceani ATCC 19707]|uniref:Multidrug transporter n=2 Tax=Nitrosococcus oceani TaxID=1229 RepID=Q3JBE2_NITOC|nr:hypothetical protein [Nitrosococcus oceani]ABA57854.1 hypothetical protein Noc_1360 [Nitrosococcus oceani ATCC 19707]EDZ66952.1 hypothetical protein NOC27_279 [Nitrosococcus oceani AFC27]KFI19734.1 hypothetical protein IB75_07095 [Nitrosococcus oceani C-27]GEM19493.1 hypothetical protein NONS58_08800 [Nitrosococcus oceani]
MAEFKQKFLTYLLCLVFFSSAASFANAADTSMEGYNQSRSPFPYTRIEDEPRYFRMIGDLLIARPLLLVATGLGTGIFLASLPFSALGGNVKEAADTLVVGPARQTFTRCLGCRISAFGLSGHAHTPETSIKESPSPSPTEKNIPSQEITPID